MYFTPCVFILNLVFGNKKAGHSLASFDLHINDKKTRKYNQNGIFTYIHALIRKISITKSPSSQMFLHFLLPAYLKRTEYMNILLY